MCEDDGFIAARRKVLRLRAGLTTQKAWLICLGTKVAHPWGKEPWKTNKGGSTKAFCLRWFWKARVYIYIILFIYYIIYI